MFLVSSHYNKVKNDLKIFVTSSTDFWPNIILILPKILKIAIESVTFNVQ